jgi:CRISPR/Cas system CMR-associated protein Cmr3 (group 5 of RAMP superfamily)
VRLQLVTPAYFKGGWKPDWMASGHPPGVDGVEVKLLAAAVPRPTAHSGWDLTKRGANGQKATRFLAPAGSVYFCEVKGDARKLWMRPISDDDQSRRDDQWRRDGFGLVLCGVWQWRQD